MNEGINLLDPNRKGENLMPERRMRLIRLVAVGMLFLVSVSAVILFILVSLSPLPELKRQEQSLRLTLSESSNDMVKLALLDERTESIAALLKDRKSYEQTLSLLQAKLPQNAKITSIRIDDNTLIVTVDSRSLTSLDTFLNGMIGYVQQKKGFSQVTLTSLANDTVRNDYSLTVSLLML